MNRYGFGISSVEVRTKQELNRHITDEEIIFHYYGGEFAVNTRIHSIRGENDPSLFIDYIDGELKWRDFGVSKIPRDAVEFCIFFYSLKGVDLNYRQAIDRITKEVSSGTFTVDPEYRLDKEKKDLRIRWRENLREYELQWWKDYTVGPGVARYFKVFSGEIWCDGNLWHYSKPKDPLFIYLWDLDNLIWKGYRPEASPGIARFISNNTAEHVQGLEFLPKKGYLLIITKSYKDVIALRLIGIWAIAPHSEAEFIPFDVLIDLQQRFELILILYDNDKTGMKNAEMFGEMYNLPYIFLPDPELKDPASVIKAEGRKSLKNFFYENELL